MIDMDNQGPHYQDDYRHNNMQFIASTSMLGLNNFNGYDHMSPFLKQSNLYNPHNQFDLSPQQNSAIMSTPLKKR